MTGQTHNGFPQLSTERLVLRRFDDNDLEDVFRGLSHPEVIRYYGVSFDAIEAAKTQLSWFADLEKNQTGVWWAVCSAANGRFFGAGGLNGISRTHRKGEIGFWLLPEYWGRGIMTEALPPILDYGFKKLQLHRIEAFVEPENINCRKALRKAGFKYEGTMEDCEIKNGAFISLEIHARFSPG